MKKYLFISICVLLALGTKAQSDRKYLAGAVPEVDGKIVFTKSIAVKDQISDEDLFVLMDKWAQENYTTENSEAKLQNKVLLSTPESKNIACQGEQYLVFRKNAFIYDHATLSYQLILNIAKGKCEATVRNLKIEYSSHSKKPVPAEDLISDKVALSKDGNDLNRYYNKFRVKTVDSVNNIFRKIDTYLNGTVVTVTTIAGATSTLSAHPSPSTSIAGYKLITADKIPEKLLNSWTIVSSGAGNKVNAMTALWGGVSTFQGKSVAFSVLNPNRFSIDTMDKEDTYFISFYTDIYNDALKAINTDDENAAERITKSGLTPLQVSPQSTVFSEAWMIIECRKGGAQPSLFSTDKLLEGEMSKEGYNKNYMGEIVNVWVK